MLQNLSSAAVVIGALRDNYLALSVRLKHFQCFYKTNNSHFEDLEGEVQS